MPLDRKAMASLNRLQQLSRNLTGANEFIQNFRSFPLNVTLVDMVPATEADATAKHLENLGINVRNTPMRIGLCTDEVIERNKFKPVSSAIMFERGNVPHPDGLFSYDIFGTTPAERRKLNGYIDLKRRFFHPYIYEALCSVQQKAATVAAGKYSWRINEKGELVQVSQDDPNYDPKATGLRWLIDHFKDLKFEKNNSYTHNEFVELLQNSTESEIFITKWPVIPVFYRDANFSGHKRDIPVLNDMYKKVIQYVNALRAPSLADFSNHTEYVIQDQLVEIRRYGQSLVQGKRGFMKQFVIGKTTAYGARSVISEPIMSGAQTPKDLMIPMIPAVAMPPIPIWRAYSLNICSADISDTVAVMPVFMRSMTCPPHIRFIRGMMTNHTRKLPQQMIRAYFSPTIYPRPRTAAPVFSLNTSLALSAMAAPKGRIFVVTVSAHNPKVDMMKS